jgi:outer membrane receptor protein involved in Fe transport
MEISKLNVGQIAFYAQDDWSVNDDFKLTIGLRADKPLYFNTSDLIQKYIDTDDNATRDNNTDYFNPENGQSVKLNSTVLPTDKLLWSLD